MGFRDWFKRRNQPAQETTPGGSRVYRSLPPEQQQATVDEATLVRMHRMTREMVYEPTFGNIAYVQEDPAPIGTPIEVYGYAPGSNKRDFWTIVSGGMSNRAMNVPPDVTGPANAREIIIYAHEYTEHIAHLVRFFARYPHRNNTWLGATHTVTNGNPATPLFDNSELVAMLFLDAPLLPEREIGTLIEPTGEPLSMLWMVPITQAELDLKLQRGNAALMELFDQHQHPLVLNPQRKSYV